MEFKDYQEAKDYADENGLPLWDTHQLPYRYYVGHLTVEIEEDEDNDWTLLED